MAGVFDRLDELIRIEDDFEVGYLNLPHDPANPRGYQDTPRAERYQRDHAAVRDARQAEQERLAAAGIDDAYDRSATVSRLTRDHLDDLETHYDGRYLACKATGLSDQDTAAALDAVDWLHVSAGLHQTTAADCDY